MQGLPPAALGESYDFFVVTAAYEGGSQERRQGPAGRATLTAAEVLPYDDERKALLLFNQSASETVQFYFEDNNTMYFEIEPQKGIHLPEAPMNQIKAKTVSGTANLTVMVG